MKQSKLILLCFFALGIISYQSGVAQFKPLEQVLTPPGTDDLGIKLHYDANVEGVLYAEVVNGNSLDSPTKTDGRIIYKSDNRGTSWFPLLKSDEQGANNLLAGRLAVHPTQANTIYVLGDHGVIKSTDGGVSWTELVPSLLPPIPDFSGGFFGSISEFQIISDEPDVLLVQTVSPILLFKSTDAGASWRNISPAAVFGSCKTSPADTQVIACPVQEGLKFSIDQGETWQLLETPISIGEVSLSPTDPDTLLLTASGGSLVGIWLSVDQGITWTKTSDTAAFTTFSVLNPQIVFGTTGDRSTVLISTDGGSTWNSSAPSAANSLLSDRFSSSTIDAFPSPWSASEGFVGTRRTGVWRTDDLGSNWQNKSDGLLARDFQFSTNPNGLDRIENLAAEIQMFSRLAGSDSWAFLRNGSGRISPLFFFLTDPLDSSVVARGPELSLDGGVTWETLEVQGERANVMLPIPGTGGEQLLRRVFGNSAEENGYIFSSDQGSTWQDLVRDEDLGIGLNRPAIAVRSNGTPVIYARGCGAINPGPDISRSDDNGTTWNTFPGPTLSVDDDCSFGSPHFFDKITPKPLKGEHVFLSTSDGVFRSNDAGENWMKFDPLGIDFSGITVSRQNPDILVAYSGFSGNIFYSLDDGTNWSTLSLSTLLLDGRTVDIDPKYVREVFFDDLSSRILVSVAGLGLIASEIEGLDVSIDSVGPSPFELAGQTLETAVTITNTSGNPINDLRVELGGAGELSCTDQQLVSLASGASISCLGDYPVRQNDVDAGVANVAVFASGEFQNSTRLTSVGSSSVPGLSLPDSSLSQEIINGNLFTRIGERILLRVVATNSGNVTLDELTFTSNTLEQSPFCQPNQFDPEFGLNTQLSPGETFFCQYEHIVSEADLASGAFSGQAFFSARTPSGELEQKNIDFVVEAGTPVLAASPEEIDFGNVTVGEQSGPMSIVVSNISNADLPIRSTSTLVEGSGISLGRITCSGTLTVGSSCSIEDIVFAPDSQGDAVVMLRVEPSASSTMSFPELTIPLRGSGSTSAVPRTFFVSGFVSGLEGNGLVLQNNGGDDLPISPNALVLSSNLAEGSFAFSTALTDGSDYDVTVASQPNNPGQTCEVIGGSGTLTGANVTNVQVTCSTASFTVGGSVAGLEGTGLVLQNNLGDDLSITSDGTFVFGTALADGSDYDVTVASQPNNPGQTCEVIGGSGTLTGANVTNVQVTCSTASFTVGGSVAGLEGTGLVLQNNLGDDLSITSDGTFVFGTALADGSDYDVTVASQPNNPGQTCEVIGGSGTLTGANVTNVQVTCSTASFTVGGSVAGLEGTGLVLQNNLGDDLSITSDGTFVFGTALADGSDYDVTVASQPNNPGQTCEVIGGSGTLTGANVTNVQVTCSNPSEVIFSDSFDGGTALEASQLLLDKRGW